MSVSPQVFNGPPTRPRLRTHGRLAFAMRRIGYRRTADVTGFSCFARKHEKPLASSGRTRDSIPHGVRSAKVGAKHARYLGTGCSDRWLPISRTASSSTFLRRRTLRYPVQGTRSKTISGANIPNLPAQFPGDFWPPPDFSEKEIGGYRGDVEDEMQKGFAIAY